MQRVSHRATEHRVHCPKESDAWGLRSVGGRASGSSRDDALLSVVVPLVGARLGVYSPRQLGGELIGNLTPASPTATQDEGSCLPCGEPKLPPLAWGAQAPRGQGLNITSQWHLYLTRGFSEVTLQGTSGPPRAWLAGGREGNPSPHRMLCPVSRGRVSLRRLPPRAGLEDRPCPVPGPRRRGGGPGGWPAHCPGARPPPLQLPLCGLIPWVFGAGQSPGSQACPSWAGSGDPGTSWVLSGVTHAVLSSALSYLEAREAESEAMASSLLCCSPFARK